MTADQFAYWLQGFTELHGEPPTAEQWQAIKDHLALVFTKVTPNRQAVPVTTPKPLDPDYFTIKCSADTIC